MSVDVSEVKRIAALARLRLSDADAARLTADLNSILEHVESLRELDTRAVDAVAGMADEVAGPRADVVGPDPLVRDAGAMSAGWQDGFFTVPRLASHEGEP